MGNSFSQSHLQLSKQNANNSIRIVTPLLVEHTIKIILITGYNFESSRFLKLISCPIIRFFLLKDAEKTEIDENNNIIKVFKFNNFSFFHFYKIIKFYLNY